MIESRFDKLRRKKAYEEGRDISLRAVARETGLSVSTIQRLSDGDKDARLSTIDVLCRYFALEDIGDLITYKPGVSHYLAYMPPNAKNPENPDSWIDISSTFQDISWIRPHEGDGLKRPHRLLLTAIGTSGELSRVSSEMDKLREGHEPILFVYSENGKGFGKRYNRAKFRFVRDGEFGMVRGSTSIIYHLQSIGEIDVILFSNQDHKRK